MSAIPFTKCPTPPEWAPEDRAALRAFLASPTGEKLREAAWWTEQAHNRKAVIGAQPFERAAGYAHGWHDAVEHFFQTLPATVPPKTDADTEEDPGADPLRERLAP